MKTLKKHTPTLVVCVDNDGYPASLEVRKLYQVLPDSEAKAHKQLRVVDESGEDYLYPASLFVSGVQLPWDKLKSKHVKIFSRSSLKRKARTLRT